MGWIWILIVVVAIWHFCFKPQNGRWVGGFPSGGRLPQKPRGHPHVRGGWHPCCGGGVACKDVLRRDWNQMPFFPQVAVAAQQEGIEYIGMRNEQAACYAAQVSRIWPSWYLICIWKDKWPAVSLFWYLYLYLYLKIQIPRLGVTWQGGQLHICICIFKYKPPGLGLPDRVASCLPCSLRSWPSPLHRWTCQC